MERIKINYTFDGMTDLLEDDVKDLIYKNITGKLDRYFQKVLKKNDSEILIKVDIIVNKQEKYEGTFNFNLDGEKFTYHNDRPFKNVADLVNHAFDHLKTALSSKI